MCVVWKPLNLQTNKPRSAQSFHSPAFIKIRTHVGPQSISPPCTSASITGRGCIELPSAAGQAIPPQVSQRSAWSLENCGRTWRVLTDNLHPLLQKNIQNSCILVVPNTKAWQIVLHTQCHYVYAFDILTSGWTFLTFPPPACCETRTSKGREEKDCSHCGPCHKSAHSHPLGAFALLGSSLGHREAARVARTKKRTHHGVLRSGWSRPCFLLEWGGQRGWIKWWHETLNGPKLGKLWPAHSTTTSHWGFELAVLHP